MPPHSASRSSTGTLNDKASSAIIVGGGIGGLAAALTLHAKGFRSIKVVEKSRYLNPEVGAGLNLQPHAVGILQELGVGEAVTAQGVAITSQSYFTAAGARVAEVPRGLAADPEGFPQIAMHRGRLHATLFGAVEQRLGKDTFIRGLKVVAFKQDDHGVTVLLGDPTTGDVLTKLRGDLLVGADGVRSAVRSVLFSEAKPRHSGLSMFRGVVVAPRFLDGATKAVAGTSQHKLSVYPIEELPPDSLDGAACSKQLINVLATLPSQPEDLNNDLSYSSDGCSPQAILERLDSGPGGALQLPYLDHKTLLNSVPQLFLWPLVDRDPLESYARGRVVLLGDAAHPMYPVGSAGASSAIVDAHELAKALAKHRVHESASKAEVEAALKEYSNLRQPLMGELQANCRAMLPEQVLDAVASELPRDAEKVPEKYGKQLASNLKQVQQVASVDAAFAKQRLLQESNGIKNTSSGAVTVPLGLNKSILRRFSPLERLLLHNKGNLQSVVSAYFNADVKVVTRYSEPRRLSGIQGAVVPNVFDREVHLCIGVRRFAICRSTVEVQDPELGKEVAANKDGIENLLARLGLAPTVELMGAGKAVIQGIQTVTRQHRMRCSGIVVTQRTFYDLEALENETGAGVAGGEDIHYGVVHMDVHQPRHSESLGELA